MLVFAACVSFVNMHVVDPQPGQGQSTSGISVTIIACMLSCRFNISCMDVVRQNQCQLLLRPNNSSCGMLLSKKELCYEHVLHA